MAPRFSVIIITRDRPEMLRDCVESIRAQAYPEKEIIVADSSKGPETRRWAESCPDVKYIYVADADNNMPKSRNVGLTLATGDFAAFIDDDATAHPGWLEALADCFNDPAVGGAGGRVVEKRRNTVVNAGDDVGRIYEDGRQVGNFTVDTGDPFDLDWVPGGNMAWRRGILSDLNGFDERYTITNACEEVDFAVRAWLAGWRVRYHPGAGIDHYAAPKANIRRDFMDPKVHYSVIRNNTYLHVKNYGLRRAFVKTYLLAGTWGSLVHSLRHPSVNNAVCFFAQARAKTIGVFLGLWVRMSGSAKIKQSSGSQPNTHPLERAAAPGEARMPGGPR